jgi:hypothetical protein
MNFVSWNTKQIINENTNNYLPEELVEESISKTLKPVMNKMKKLNIGLPYRDARLFFFQFLKDKHPNLVPQGYETKKPTAKDVNAIVGQIAMEKPELLDKFGEEFETYSQEETDAGMDRVSQFLNVAATMRTGKGVRPSKAAADTQGYVKKDYSKLTAQEIASATTDAIKKKEAEFEAGDDVSDEKLLIKTVASSVLTKLADEDLNPQALKNVADAMTKIETLPRFKQFLDYIGKMEEYSVIHQYLSDQLDVIETNLEDLQAEKEDAEMEAQEGNIHDEVRQDPREVDPVADDIEQAKEKEEDESRCPVTGKLRKSDEEHKDMSVLSPEDYANAVDAGEIDPEDYGYNTLQKFYFKKREGGEDEEKKAKKDHDGDGKLESSTDEYMGARDKAIKAAMEKEEDNQEIALSPQEVARQMLIQRQKEMQNYYTQERLNRYGY